MTDHPAPLTALLDGTLLPPETPLLRPDDLGVLRGEGVFETTLVVDGVARDLDDHLARLAISAEMTGLVVPAPDRWRTGVDALVQAWGSGDRARMEALGTAEVLHILGDQGGPHWDQTSVEGATGSTIVTYTNTDSGDTLELRVENEAASQGAEQSVVEARYTVAADNEDAVPTVPTDYADSLVVAWGTDDQATMERLATP